MLPKRGRRFSDQVMRKKKGQRTMPEIMRQPQEG